MTEPIHCRGCPFAGCVWCAYKGSEPDEEQKDDD